MRLAFGRFVLDEPSRTLRLDGQERALQPLVFDLLVYLARHRERVVPKDELLERLWEGTTVTDGSLQRAVSLLRTVLREGAAEDAVQTFARRGYRFCGVAEAHSASPALEARRLADAGDWARAAEAFAALPDTDALGAEDWEAWGNAAMCAGRPTQAFAPLEQAIGAYERSGDAGRAARVALVLANSRLESRELAIARGWHERARTHLQSVPECREHGFSEWLSSRLALFEGRLDDCRAAAARAKEIGDRVADPDLHCLGLIYQGHIFIALGEVRRGLALHDEAGAAALADRASPFVNGIVFCSVIWAYLHLGDHHRAGQWTDQFTRWCERHAAYCYPALCRLHRGEILAVRGELAAAETEVSRARDQLAVAGPFCEGDAWRVLGDIRLSRGELEAAEFAFREAHRLGWNPQPGFALLLAARGDAAGALNQLERALAQPSWTDGQRRGSMLAVLARIAAPAGKLERARAALAELDAAPELGATQAVAAERARARAELGWADGDVRGAEAELRGCVATWLQVAAPLYAADARVRLTELLLAAGDATSADLELGAAEAAFRRANAEPWLRRCAELRAAFPG